MLDTKSISDLKLPRFVTMKNSALRLVNEDDEWRYYRDARYFGVGEGWYSIIKDLIIELIDMGWDKRIIQCKQKFGGLRFYIETYPEESAAIITKYERLSFETCEKCGEKGEAKKINGWAHTLCEPHEKEKYENN